MKTKTFGRTLLVPLVLGFLVFAVSACDTTVQSGSSSGRILPNITGGAGEVLVVCDNYIWDGATGEKLKDILQEEFPGLPQSEPLFDVTHITPASFDNLFKFHRSVLLITIKESADEPTVSFRKDVWAKSQIVAQLEAKNKAELDQLLNDNAGKIQNFLIHYDRQRLTDSYQDSKDLEIQKLMAQDHQIRLAIPRGYNIDFSNSTFSSISIETPEFSQVIQVYEYPGTEDDLSSDKILEKRNEMVGKYVKGPNEGSYMSTSKAYPPIFYDLSRNNTEIVETRGLWELEGGYMGGPFVSHSVFDAKRNRILVVEGYLYYPNQKKRVKIRQLEAIIYSLEIL